MSCDTKNKIAIFMTNINDYEYYREFIILPIKILNQHFGKFIISIN